MRFTPGALRSAAKNLISRGTPTAAMTSMSNVLLFYKGTMPTQSEIETKTALRNSRDIQTVNCFDLLSTRGSDYMGAIGWRNGVASSIIPDPNGELLEIQMAGNDVTLAGLDNNPLVTRTSRIIVAGIPTWFVFLGSDTYTNFNLNVDTYPITANPTAISTFIIGTVGNEDSTADLKLIGGQIYRNADGDYTRTPQLHNLKVKIR